MADNYLDVERRDSDDGSHNARVTVRTEHQTDVGATLDAGAAEEHIRAVAEAMGWTVVVTDPGALDETDSGS